MADTCKHSFTWTSSGVTKGPPEWGISTCGLCGTQAQWREGAWRVSIESAGSLAIAQVENLGSSLQEILAVLGTGACKQNKCEGCQWEVGEAIRIAREAHGV